MLIGSKKLGDTLVFLQFATDKRHGIVLGGCSIYMHQNLECRNGEDVGELGIDPLPGEASVESRAEISDLLVLSEIHFAESAHRYAANLRSLSRHLATLGRAEVTSRPGIAVSAT